MGGEGGVWWIFVFASEMVSRVKLLEQNSPPSNQPPQESFPEYLVQVADLASPIWSSILQEKYFAFTLKNYNDKERPWD